MKQIPLSTNHVMNDYYLLDPILKERHNLALPPNEAYLYFPQEEVLFVHPSRPDKILRRIFSGVVFTPYENMKYVELTREMNKRLIMLPQWWEESESRRFLQATSFDISKAIEFIQKQIAWRFSYFPIAITDRIIEILNTGFMYIHGRDCNFRPVFVIQARRYFDISRAYSYEELFLAIIYFLEYIIKHLLIIGQVENWIMISDLTDVNVLFMPRELKRLIDALSSCYRCRLYKNFILGLSTGMRWLFKLATSCIDEVTIKKISVLEKSKWGVIKEFINKDNLEAKFGGKAPNLAHGTNSYFPPVMPSLNYKLPGKSELISEEEYKAMTKSKQPQERPLVIGQYYQDKWEKEVFEVRRRKKEKSIRNWRNGHNDSSISEIKRELKTMDNYQTFSNGKMFMGLKDIIRFDIINNTSPSFFKKRTLDPPRIEESGSFHNSLHSV